MWIAIYFVVKLKIMWTNLINDKRCLFPGLWRTLEMDVVWPSRSCPMSSSPSSRRNACSGSSRCCASSSTRTWVHCQFLSIMHGKSLSKVRIPCRKLLLLEVQKSLSIAFVLQFLIPLVSRSSTISSSHLFVVLPLLLLLSGIFPKKHRLNNQSFWHPLYMTRATLSFPAWF